MTALVILKTAAARYGVTKEEVLSNARGTHGAQFVAVRRETAKALREKGWSMARIGLFLRMHHTSVCHLLKTETRVQPEKDIIPAPIVNDPPYDPNAPDLSGEWNI